jgi:hypothetical protein
MTLPALAEADEAAKELGKHCLEALDKVAQELSVTEKPGWKLVRALADSALTKAGAQGVVLYGYTVAWAAGAYIYGLADSGALSAEKTDTALTQTRKALGESPIEKITSLLTALYSCPLCGKQHETWSIPSEHWQKLPEELQDKDLCYNCYLKVLQEKQG